MIASDYQSFGCMKVPARAFSLICSWAGSAAWKSALQQSSDWATARLPFKQKIAGSKSKSQALKIPSGPSLPAQGLPAH